MNLTPENLITPKQLSELIQVSISTLANWRCCKTGPPFFHTGKKVWYAKDQLSAWIEQQQKKSATVFLNKPYLR
jgi:predicted DNA-binding transcriptional regulator AlpA